MNRNSSLLDLFDSDNEGNSSGSKTENFIEDNGNLIKLKLPKYKENGIYTVVLYRFFNRF